jgi:hypothetical protein
VFRIGWAISDFINCWVRNEIPNNKSILFRKVPVLDCKQKARGVCTCFIKFFLSKLLFCFFFLLPSLAAHCFPSHHMLWICDGVGSDRLLVLGCRWFGTWLLFLMSGARWFSVEMLGCGQYDDNENARLLCGISFSSRFFFFFFSHFFF